MVCVAVTSDFMFSKGRLYRLTYSIPYCSCFDSNASKLLMFVDEVWFFPQINEVALLLFVLKQNALFGVDFLYGHGYMIHIF